MTRTPNIPGPLTLINAAELASEIHLGLTGDVRGGLQRLAELLGQPYTTVYSTIQRVEQGEQEGLPLDILRAAHFIVGPRLDRYLLWPGQQVIPDAPLDMGPEGPTPSLAERECGDVCIKAGQLLAEVRVLLEKERISRPAELVLRQEIKQAHEHLHHISKVLDAYHPQPGRAGSGE